MLSNNNFMNDFNISYDNIKSINSELEKLKLNMESLGDDLFFDIADVMRITGFSRQKVQWLFQHSAFPATNIGKKKLVLKTAFIKFFSERRCIEDETYWKF